MLKLPNESRRKHRMELEENRALHMRSLVEKTEEFLRGRYFAPTTLELKALRRELKIRKEDACKNIDISLRTWTAREAGNGVSNMKRQEFAMIVLFLIRSTKYWSQVDGSVLLECLPARGNTDMSNTHSKINGAPMNEMSAL